MINKRAREWLQGEFKDWESLRDENDWALCLSPLFDRCKRTFDGQTSRQMYRGNGWVKIPPFVPI